MARIDVRRLEFRFSDLFRVQDQTAFPDTAETQVRVESSLRVLGCRNIISLLAAFEVAASSGESAEEELLDQACANPFGRADRKISEDEPVRQ